MGLIETVCSHASSFSRMETRETEKKKKEGVREDRKVMRPCDKKVTHRIGKYKYLSRFIVVFVISHIEPGQVYDYAVSL